MRVPCWALRRRCGFAIARAVAGAVLVLGSAAALPVPAALADKLDVGAMLRLTSSIAYSEFKRKFRRKALKKGIRPQVFDRAFAGVRPNPKVLQLADNQPEFSTPLWDYIEKRVSPLRIKQGREKLIKHRQLVEKLEKRYGVDKHAILSIWGMESNYGSYKGNMSVIRSLATLAITGKRRRFGESQLIAALKILQRGDIGYKQFNGSWAGAMGHTQFIPTTYNAYAVDWTGDGKRDIWNSVADALASTASYLKKSGWKGDRPWGWEVKVPQRFNRRLVGYSKRRNVEDWARLGLKPAGGGRFGAGHATSWLIQPTGRQGPVFLVTRNFKAILRYNNSTAYALAVGLLADRISGRGPLVGSWPADTRVLSRDERIEMQKLLAQRGHYSGKLEGRFGKRTFAAIRAYQDKAGLPADGYADQGLLNRLRRGH